MMALLIDPDGYVLSLSGNKQTLKRAKHINFIEGVKWTEANCWHKCNWNSARN